MRKEDLHMTTLTVSEAKNKLTSLRREALTGKEILLDDGKRKENQPVSLISTALLDDLCDSKVFTYQWTDEPDNDQPHYSLWNNETGVYGVGETKSEAAKDFMDNIQDYANVFFNDLPYYLSRSGNTYGHYWYLRRVLRCNGDMDSLYKVLDLGGMVD
jgi:hypothetical protein